MTAVERLSEVFDRGVHLGVDSLGSEDRDLYRIQEFIIDIEMGGLSGYFYNRLPDIDGFRATVAAMKQFGLVELAVLLSEAVDLFAGYATPDTPTTWGEVLRRYDPADRLHELTSRIYSLDNYGLDKSSV